jgi:DegV family protein with EDD domain
MQESLNDINVFPVPDNDTGTNMALTMQSVAEGVIDCGDDAIASVSRAAADSALMGARGNSGAILAQFFYGLAEGLRDKVQVKVHQFVEAASHAAEAAHDAIANPQEGTILTVIRDWVHRLHERRQAGDFVELLSDSLQAARESLAHTPEKLRVLAKAGVVDAGAQGFVHLLEGIDHFLQSGTIERWMGIKDSARRTRPKRSTEEIRYQYCTECLLEGEGINRLALRDELAGFGDSLIVAGSDSKVRVHVHTDDPQGVFDLVGQYGTVVQTKYDDMTEQHEEAVGQAPSYPIAIVIDSACDLPPEFIIRHNIQMVPVQVSFGNDLYIDKITLTPKEFYRLLRESPHHPKTSQPAPADFLRIYEELIGRYEQVISIHLSGSLSGTFQAACTAASRVEGLDIQVLDSRTVSIAYGLVVAEAVRAVEEGCDIDDVVQRVRQAVSHTKIYVSVATMEYLVRGGRVSRTRGLIANLLGLKPILTINDEGRVVAAAKTRGGDSAERKIFDLIRRDAVTLRNLRFAVTHANAHELAEHYAQQIRREFEVQDVMIVEASPALGAHAGPGAVAVALSGHPRGR